MTNVRFPGSYVLGVPHWVVCLSPGGASKSGLATVGASEDHTILPSEPITTPPEPASICSSHRRRHRKSMTRTVPDHLVGPNESITYPNAVAGTSCASGADPASSLDWTLPDCGELLIGSNCQPDS